jgi:hypothetical protein
LFALEVLGCEESNDADDDADVMMEYGCLIFSMELRGVVDVEHILVAAW